MSVKDLGLAALAAAVLAGVVWLFAWWPPSPPASGISAAEVQRATAAPTETEPPMALMVGDSYSAGVALADPSDAFPHLVAERCGWQLLLDGEPGTGYLNEGLPQDDGRVYAQRVPDYTNEVDLAVFTGGYNDYWAIERGESLPAFRTAVDHVLDVAGRTMPGARLAVVGVWWPKAGPVPAQVHAMDSILKRAAQRHEATFVPADWFHEGDLGQIVSDDDIHPTEAGQQLISDQLVDQLPSCS